MKWLKAVSDREGRCESRTSTYTKAGVVFVIRPVHQVLCSATYRLLCMAAFATDSYAERTRGVEILNESSIGFRGHPVRSQMPNGAKLRGYRTPFPEVDSRSSLVEERA